MQNHRKLLGCAIPDINVAQGLHEHLECPIGGPKNISRPEYPRALMLNTWLTFDPGRISVLPRHIRPGLSWDHVSTLAGLER